MSKYRNALPHVSGNQLFLTDGGMETDLIFNRGVDLPQFAAIWMHKLAGGENTLREYFVPYLEMAREKNAGFVFESTTWRSGRDWAEPLGLSEGELAQLNTRAITFLNELRDEFETAETPMVISGCIGPRGDGYSPGNTMTIAEARQYSSWQVNLLKNAGADQVSALTMNYIEEAVGVALAAKDAGIPVAISFTVETDGRLPTGDTLEAAIEAVDNATGNYPAYFMVNCAHPDHFGPTLRENAAWVRRIRGLRANASRCSHEELDNSEELDIGNPHELGSQYAELLARLPQLRVFGGCCGTDLRHVQEIAAAVFTENRSAA